MKENLRKLIGGILLVSLFVLSVYKPFLEYIQIPGSITLFEGQEFSIANASAVSVVDSHSTSSNISWEVNDHAISLLGKIPGEDKMILQYAGIPVKEVNVNVLKDFKIYPGGQSIGVRLNTLGVLVVGHHLVSTETGKSSPGEEAGIQVGDIITSINGQKMENMASVSPFVNEAGKNKETLKMTIQRGKDTFTTELKPLLDEKEKSYKLGLYIRDSAAGIGTMTFYDPKSMKYGALGHVISDMDTKKPIVVEDGKIVMSTVTSIEKGKNGTPGEKLARFSPEREVIGDITINSPFGIFGKLHDDIENGIYDKPMSIALSHEIKEGPAKILTVVDGNKVEWKAWS